MSSKYKGRVVCENCGHRTSSEDEVGKWFRKTLGTNVSIQDVDYIFHRFLTHEDGRGTRDLQYWMIVETKTFCADMDDAQRDTLLIADNVLRTHPRKRERNAGRFTNGHSENPIPVRRVIGSGSRNVILFGVHKLRMNGACPASSTWWTWDDKPITYNQLVSLLRFELHPDTLKGDMARRRKRGLPKQTTLFERSTP